MPRWWKRMALWARIYVVLEIPIFLLLVWSFLFDHAARWVFLFQLALLVFFFIMNGREMRRKKRDGSYWGPRE